MIAYTPIYSVIIDFLYTLCYNVVLELVQRAKGNQPVNLPNIFALIGAITAIVGLASMITVFFWKPVPGKLFKRSFYVLCLAGFWSVATTFVMMWLSKTIAPNGGDLELLGNMTIGALIAAAIFSTWPVMELITLRKERAHA